MKVRSLLLACAVLSSAGAAEAKTFVIYIDPMTLERRMVVIDTPGRDRVLMCMAPPGESGCTEVRTKRQP